jgi:ABC-type phosphate transport system substrate-binding protein
MNKRLRRSMRFHIGFHLSAGAALALLAGLLLLTDIGSVLGQATAPSKPAASTSSGKPDRSSTVRVAGPLAARELLKQLAAEFSKGREPIAVDYMPTDTTAAGVSAFVDGRDLLLTFGRVSDKNLFSSQQRWHSLAPQEHVLGARVVAVVVHARNAVDSLTLEQMQALFSGKLKDWQLLGGEGKTIRRYGLLAGDPVSSIFHDKVLPTGRCAQIMRKKTSAEVLTALSSDPDGVGFVDVAALTEAGETIKVVALGEGSAAALPNAQTIKDGSYNLAEMLVLYDSAKVSPAAKGLAEFALSGHQDAICRQQGFMPTMRLVQADALALFSRLYGADFKRVAATGNARDAFALADQIVLSAQTTKLAPEVTAVMCQKAYDLGCKYPGGEVSALRALHVLAEKVPERRFEAALCHATLCERDFTSDKSDASGQYLVERLMIAADLATLDGHFTEAAETWRHALTVAEGIKSPTLGVLRERLPVFAARQESVKHWEEFKTQLQEQPKDDDLRAKAVWFCVLEINNPAEALRLINKNSEEALRANLPLAVESQDKLNAEAALGLAEWYMELTDKAGQGGRDLVLRRSQDYYLRFFALHKDREDALAIRATLGLKKVGGTVPDPTPAVTPGKPPPPPKVVVVPVDGELTNLRLAEFVVTYPDVGQVSTREVGSARLLSDLRPLLGLPKIGRLELTNAAQIKDISTLAKLTNLTWLRLRGVGTEDFSALSALGKLGTLDIGEAPGLRDLTPLAGLTRLTVVSLPQTSIADLKPLGSLKNLTRLDFAGCAEITDLEPLAALAPTLTSLGLSGCTGVKDLAVLSKLTKLKGLDLRGCPAATPENLATLGQNLPGCKIWTDDPK